jgi:hypothetical protein
MLRLKRAVTLTLGLLLSVADTQAQAANTTLTDMDIQRLAANIYASGELPLGDNHYVIEAPRKGYIYMCHVGNDRDVGEGATRGSAQWIHGISWNLFGKSVVQGDVRWTHTQFFDNDVGENRVLAGNGVPINHSTGIFPVPQSDPAFLFDRNPNAITEQKIDLVLPRAPVYSETPYCMGMESGLMLTGVPIFNGFDAGMRDAAAHEVQDKCGGHPQHDGQYHYHSLSGCIKDIGEKTILGYALDGFPITGPLVAPGRYLTTDDLDECHGITSEIIDHGQPIITYHYVMTQDFPYSVSCFRARPVRLRISDTTRGDQGRGKGTPTNTPKRDAGDANAASSRTQPVESNGAAPEAVSACTDHRPNSACSFHSTRGPVSGNCQALKGRPLACAPGWAVE